jgi:spermidine/putrescine transport system permease protein
MKIRGASSPYIVWMSIFIIVPLAVVVYFAFTDSMTGAFTFGNVLRLEEYLPIFLKSVWLALIASAICLFLGYPTAYYIARSGKNSQRFLILLVMLPMCMSFLLRTLAWVSLLEDTGLINRALKSIGLRALPLSRNSAAVVLGMVYNYLPYMILPLHSVLVKMDPTLIEAAQDLGCAPGNVFLRVTLPLSKPGIISGVTMVFVPAVSTFYISKKLGSAGTVLIGDVIESQFKTAYNPNLGAALSLILMVLIFICIGLMNASAVRMTKEW